MILVAEYFITKKKDLFISKKNFLFPSPQKKSRSLFLTITTSEDTPELNSLNI